MVFLSPWKLPTNWINALSCLLDVSLFAAASGCKGWFHMVLIKLSHNDWTIFRLTQQLGHFIGRSGLGSALSDDEKNICLITAAWWTYLGQACGVWFAGLRLPRTSRMINCKFRWVFPERGHVICDAVLHVVTSWWKYFLGSRNRADVMDHDSVLHIFLQRHSARMFSIDY